MEPPHAKSVKRRRRRLIVAFILVSTVSWWYWPRGDARFVGKWQMHLDSSPQPYAIVDLQRNGIARFTFLPSHFQSSSCWIATPDRVRYGVRSKSVFSIPLMWMSDWTRSWTGHTFWLNEETWQIIEGTADRVVMNKAADAFGNNGPHAVVLTRIPD
jgi:hypothetical protein